ncbi:MAG TPA: methyltransferase domain-containing protein [Thiolapillus brandeum]|uniref:Arsenite methyltransferase n=1 Tax=Thiolapillus brandeum TaxID=1076588 RepID=A0A831JR49_9GAMM|nr:methyltransferase domain-containing protein [Thiolapillus brandeum]
MTEEVKFYYGKVLQSSNDLKTDACCTTEAMPGHIKSLMQHIHPEVSSRYYGCGLVVPELLEGCRILDLGSGTGQDVFLLAGLVGEQGEVVGVDMTPEQLEVARRHEAHHQAQFGYNHPNTRFIEGRLEKLLELDLTPASFDVIVSNCVLNLVQDKAAVLQGAFELLKPGGEFYFSDVYADRRLPEALKNDPVLYGECLSGALYWNDFLQLAKASGFADPRLVTDRSLSIDDPEQQEKLGEARFFSATYRLIKLDDLEAFCEDYGQAVRYRGSIPHHPHAFTLDKHHVMETGRIFPVCGNTWRMLHDTRFAPHFEFFGDFSIHYGIFADCGTSLPFDTINKEPNNSGGCC